MIGSSTGQLAHGKRGCSRLTPRGDPRRVDVAPHVDQREVPVQRVDAGLNAVLPMGGGRECQRDALRAQQRCRLRTSCRIFSPIARAASADSGVQAKRSASTSFSVVRAFPGMLAWKGGETTFRHADRHRAAHTKHAPRRTGSSPLDHGSPMVLVTKPWAHDCKTASAQVSFGQSEEEEQRVAPVGQPFSRPIAVVPAPIE
jgi:hypothetical protein